MVNNASSQGVRPAAWTDHERLVNLSAVDMAQVMAGEKQDHPSFADKLDETQRFLLLPTSARLALPMPTRLQQMMLLKVLPLQARIRKTMRRPSQLRRIPSTITISGKISNATPGGIVPPGTTVQLSAYQGMSLAFDVPEK